MLPGGHGAGGTVTTFRLPSGGEIGLYQPTHATAIGGKKKEPQPSGQWLVTWKESKYFTALSGSSCPADLGTMYWTM